MIPESKQGQPNRDKDEGKQMEPTNYKGYLAPFREIRGGFADHPTADTMAQSPSTAMVGSVEAIGKVKQNQQRAELVLGRKAPGIKKGDEGFPKGATTKRNCKEVSPGKVKGIRHYFEAKGGSSAPSLESSRNEDQCSGPIKGTL